MKLNMSELIKKINGEGNLIILGDWNSKLVRELQEIQLAGIGCDRGM
jgi:hypothetical protein